MMHATHQFFLTTRSLYLLVLNRRQGGCDREADYWFRLIRAFGGKDAPVIVVLNKQKSEPFDVNRGDWLEKYAGNIKGFAATDCTDKKSINDLKRKIQEAMRQMQSIQTRFPRHWKSDRA
jgi:internalin A